MHYANGREAKNGDKIMRVGVTGSMYPRPLLGVLHEAIAGNDTCNGFMAQPADSGNVNLAECLHVDDVQAAIGDIKSVKDTSKPVPQ
jgi:hypothetical protein